MGFFLGEVRDRRAFAAAVEMQRCRGSGVYR